MASVPGNLTTAEASSYQSTSDFSVSPCGRWATYTVTRGRMIAGPHGDGGKELMLLELGGGGGGGGGRFELLTGCSVLSATVWTASEDGSSCPIVRSGSELLLFSGLSVTQPEAVTTQTLLELPAGSGAAAESFAGSPVCVGGTVVFATSSGHAHPAEGRSFIRALSIAKALQGSVAASWLLYATPPSIRVGNVCLDSTAATVAFTRTSEFAHHNDILIVSVTDPVEPLLVGAEARATYGSNSLSFGADGSLYYKGNCPSAAADYIAEDYTGDALPPAVHGLHRLSTSSAAAGAELIPVCGEEVRKRFLSSLRYHFMLLLRKIRTFAKTGSGQT
jgi:hypothetical protein